MKYDFVIIGSGLGGLLCGYILAKEGYSVCIVEKNNILGGCLQTFTRNENIFDTGIHYVGGLQKGQTLYKYFEYFGLNDKIKIKKLDENCFDKICFFNSDEEYAYSMGNENFISALSEKFPSENMAVVNYLKKLKNIYDSHGLLNLNMNSTNWFTEKMSISENAYEYIRSITPNTKLQNVLAGINLLYAGVSSKSPLYVHSLINYSYIQSAYRFIDGSAQVAEHLVKSIENFGGAVIKNYEADEFVFSGDKLTAVKSTEDEILEAENIISAIHPQSTLKMLGKEKVRKVYWNRISNLENTTSSFVVYISFKKDMFPYYNYNFYLYKSGNVWNLENNNSEEWPANAFCFTPAYTGQMRYAKSMILMTYMNFAEVEKWSATTVGRRGQDYKDFKNEKAAMLIDFIAWKFPNIKECIESFTVSTPLTYRDYTGTIDGSIYGIMRDCNEPLRTHISHKTKIPNLFLTETKYNYAWNAWRNNRRYCDDIRVCRNE